MALIFLACTQIHKYTKGSCKVFCLCTNLLCVFCLCKNCVAVKNTDTHYNMTICFLFVYTVQQIGIYEYTDTKNIALFSPKNCK
jgi:hypothetical protein